jgi:hypothetical protein
VGCFVIRKADRTIKSYSEKFDDVLSPGESVEQSALSFEEYAGQLQIKCNGRSGEIVKLKVGGAPGEVGVFCPNRPTVKLLINEAVVVVQLVNGHGTLELSAMVAGKYIIKPEDRVLFCEAGEGSIMVEVEE